MLMPVSSYFQGYDKSDKFQDLYLSYIPIQIHIHNRPTGTADKPIVQVWRPQCAVSRQLVGGCTRLHCRRAFRRDGERGVMVRQCDVAQRYSHYTDRLQSL